MPKMSFRFKIPEEQIEFNMALRGSKYHGVLWDFKEWLHQKAGNPPKGSAAQELFKEVVDAFYDLLDGVDLEES